MFSLAAPRFIQRLSSAAPKAAPKAATSLLAKGMPAMGLAASEAQSRSMSGKPQSDFGQMPASHLAGVTSGKPRKSVEVRFSKNTFPSKPKIENVKRIHHASRPGVWKKLLPNAPLPSGLSVEQYEALLIEKLRKKGILLEEAAVDEIAGESMQGAFGNAELADAAPAIPSLSGAFHHTSPVLSPMSHRVIVDQGKYFAQFSSPVNAANIEEVANDVRTKIPVATPILQEQLNIEFREVLLKTSLNKNRVDVLKASELLYWEPLRNFIFQAGRVPGVKALPGMSSTGVFRSIYLPELLMLSRGNVGAMQKNPTLSKQPSQEGYLRINQDIFDILRYKLSYEPTFNPKEFKQLFDPASILKLKTALVKCYLTKNQELAKALFSNFLECANFGLLTPIVYKQFLSTLEVNPEAAFKLLLELLGNAAKRETLLKGIHEETFIRSKGWFAGKMFWQFVAGSGVVSLLLFISFSGTSTGIPIIDNFVFRNFIAGRAEDLVKEQYDEFTKSRFAALGRLVVDKIVEPVMKDAQETGKPILQIKEAAQQKYEEVTEPYMKKSWLQRTIESLRGLTRKNKASKQTLTPLAEVNESRITNND
jgi:hypothetical protein